MIHVKKEKQPHFLIVGHGGFFNRGCEAILDTTFRLLSERFDSPTFTVVSFDWENDRHYGKKWEKVTFRKVIPERWRSPHWYLRTARRLLHLTSGDWRTMHSHLRREYARADAVLSVGGDNYTTDYSAFPKYYLDVLEYAKEQGSKGVIWGATIGPFDDGEVRRKVVEVLKDTALITARESLTMEYLASVGVSGNVRAVADTAFLLEPSRSPAAVSSGVGEGGDWLGICASSMLWKYVSDEGSRDRSDVLVNLIDRIVDDVGFSVALIPHVIDTRPDAPLGKNDHAFLTQIAGQVRKRERVTLVGASPRAAELKYVISRCRFFIGSRTHSTIAALSGGVPTISLSYSMKSRGINQDVLGHQDFVLPVAELSVETLMGALGDLMKREEEIRATLRERTPRIKEMARRNGQYLAELLEVESGEKHGR